MKKLCNDMEIFPFLLGNNLSYSQWYVDVGYMNTVFRKQEAALLMLTLAR